MDDMNKLSQYALGEPILEPAASVEQPKMECPEWVSGQIILSKNDLVISGLWIGFSFLMMIIIGLCVKVMILSRKLDNHLSAQLPPADEEETFKTKCLRYLDRIETQIIVEQRQRREAMEAAAAVAAAAAEAAQQEALQRLAEELGSLEEVPANGEVAVSVHEEGAAAARNPFTTTSL